MSTKTALEWIEAAAHGIDGYEAQTVFTPLEMWLAIRLAELDKDHNLYMDERIEFGKRSEEKIKVLYDRCCELEQAVREKNNG